jgi:inorganic triphosphatase YgiF
MGAVLEVELKLRADAGALRELARTAAIGPASLGPPTSVDELDRYLDTADGALAAARWACRARTREARTWISLKGPAQQASDESVHRRPEVEGPAPDDVTLPAAAWPESPARDLVLRLAGEQPLSEILRLRQRRVERDARVGQERIGTLSLDEVVVERAGRELGRMRIVELELTTGLDPAVGRPLMDALRARDDLRPEPASKLERALEMARGASGEVR